MPLKGFEVGEQRPLQPLGFPPRPRWVRLQPEGLQPPTRASDAAPDGLFTRVRGKKDEFSEVHSIKPPRSAPPRLGSSPRRELAGLEHH